MRSQLIFTFLIVLSSFALAQKDLLLQGKVNSRAEDLLNYQNTGPYRAHVKKCLSELELHLSMRGSKDYWVKQAPVAPAGQTYRTRTATLGHWLEVTVDKAGMPTLYIVNSELTESVSFNSACKPETKFSSGLNFSHLVPDTMADWFTDRSLQKLLAKSKKGLIYVWSPEMVYSAKHFKNFQNAARKLNIDFIPLIDPRTQLGLVDQMSKLYGVPPAKMKLNSVELYMRNLTVHYPTSIVYQNGQLHESLIVGVMDESDLISQIAKRLNE